MKVNDRIECCSLVGGICNYLNDEQKTILEGTTGFFNMLGYTPEEFETIFHSHAVEIIAPEDLGKIEQQTKASPDRTAEFRIMHKDGTKHWILARFEVIRREAGVAVLQGIFTDITETKQKLIDQEFVNQNIPCGVGKFLWDGVGRLIEANDKFYSMFGTTPADYQESAFQRFSKADAEKFRQYCEKRVPNGEDYGVEFKAVNKNTERVMWARVDAKKVGEENGCPIYLGIVIDITKQKELQAQLEAAKRLYQSASDSTEDIVFDYDIIKDRLKLIKPELSGSTLRSKTYEYDRYLRKMNTLKFIHPDDFEQVYQNCTGTVGYPFEARIRLMNQKPGEYTWVKITVSKQLDENQNTTHLVGVIRDIDTEVRERRLLIDRATTDPLTGIHNRMAAADLVTKYLQEKTNNADYAMLIMDLDNFKPVNDTYGHIFGDNVLTQFAKNLREVVRIGDVIGRLGGDEFTIFIPSVTEERVREIATAICSMTRDIYVGDLEQLSCSIGAVVSNRKDVNMKMLFKSADNALYMKKSSGKNGICITRDIVEDPNEELKLSYQSDRNTSAADNNIERRFSDVIFGLLEHAQDKQKVIPMTMAMLGDKYH